jgi:ligand-binding sensor domain-containing protein/serine phosphatase RsbU (regulator of sigma subunit)
MKSYCLPTSGSFLSMMILVFISSFSLAQSPIFLSHSLGQEKNAPKVECIVSDVHNQIFFGTNKGLVSYNGLEYTSIPLSDDEPRWITSLAYDSANVLWIGTKSGEIFKYSNQIVVPFLHETFSETGRIGAITHTKNGTIVSTYGAGVFFVNNDSILKHVTSENGLADDYTYDAVQHNSFVWIATDGGIAKLSLQGDAIDLLKTKDGLPDNIVHKILELDDHTLAIGMYDYGVAYFNSNNNKFTLATENQAWEKGKVSSLISQEDGELWIGTDLNGIVCLSFKKDRLHQKALTQMNGLVSNRINCFHQDAENNVWIGTNKGASLFTGGDFEFIGSPEGLVNKNVFDVIEDRSSKVWIANETGVEQFYYLENGEYRWNSIVESSDENPVQVVCLYEDRDQNIWMGTFGQGLWKYDRKLKRVVTFTKKDGLPNENILDIVQDEKGTLWLATLGGGVISMREEEGQFVYTKLADKKGVASTGNYIYDLHLDNNQLLYYATDGNGIGVFDCRQMYHKPLDIEGINQKTIYSITSDSSNNLWFSVADEGLKRLKDGKITDYNLESGIRSTRISSIHLSNHGDVIVAHDKGIDVIQKNSDLIIPFFPNKSGSVFDVNLNGSSFTGSSVWYGTEQGVVKFTPSPKKGKLDVPQVWLDRLLVNYEDWAPKSDDVFEYDQNHFDFNYLGIWMKNPSEVVYSYILEGFDQTWSYETKSLMATYSSLPPGQYSFKVRARNENRIWSSTENIAYNFEIKKPFWQEWWFYLAVLLISIFSVGGFIKYRTQKLIADKQFLEKEVQNRTTEIRMQKNIIEHKSNEILSSITYAKRIQEAILPPVRLVKAALPNSFILYKPKDIVAGDFYWMETVDDLVIFAAADCTGHGVPGAMVSVVCSNALNRAVREFGLTEPAKILDKTLELVIERFEKSEEDVKDGMDIALCALNSKTNELQFAGANNPLWIIKGADNTLLETKATKQPIGKYADPKPYVNHVMKLEKGDSLYVFSDGFPDQFGGEKGKKLKTKAFKELLLSVQDKSMAEQHKTIDQYFENWRGDQEQIDDVCVIGVKL